MAFDPKSRNNVVIRQGALDSDIYLIVSGRLSVQVNGREVAVRNSGQHVGEMALIDPRAVRSATIIATEPSVLAKITEPDFSRLARKYPQLWRRLAIELADRLRQRGRFHTPPNDIPHVFIGSSVERLLVAQNVIVVEIGMLVEPHRKVEGPPRALLIDDHLAGLKFRFVLVWDPAQRPY